MWRSRSPGQPHKPRRCAHVPGQAPPLAGKGRAPGRAPHSDWWRVPEGAWPEEIYIRAGGGANSATAHAVRSGRFAPGAAPPPSGPRGPSARPLDPHRHPRKVRCDRAGAGGQTVWPVAICWGEGRVALGKVSRKTASSPFGVKLLGDGSVPQFPHLGVAVLTGM